MKAWQVGLVAGVRAFRQSGDNDKSPEFVDDDDLDGIDELDEIELQFDEDLELT